MKILLVGGGITGAITGMYLRKLLPDCYLSMWDKARGIGGRMMTSRCALNANCTADLGAQYITTTEDYINANGDIYDGLLLGGVLEPLKCKIIGLKAQGNIINFVSPNGIGFVVEHFIEKAKLNEIKFFHHVLSINKEEDKWIVETKTGEKGNFDVVILTMPVPELFCLEGSFKNEVHSDLTDKLKAVTYSSRYVLILFFVESLNENWGAQYVDNNPVIRFVAIDNIKRGQPEYCSAAVFHTTVDFGLKHVEDSLPEIEKALMYQAKLLFLDWPEPTSSKCHKWRYSQVMNVYCDMPGCVVVSNTPPLLVGGDGFVGSTFDNCVKSSKVICDKVKQVLQL